MNTHLGRKWRSRRGAKHGVACAAGCGPEFVDIQIPAHPETAERVASQPTVVDLVGEPLIQMELRHGLLRLNVRMPAAAAAVYLANLSEVSSGMLVARVFGIPTKATRVKVALAAAEKTGRRRHRRFVLR